MTSFNSYAAAVVITGNSQPTYTNTGTLTFTPTSISPPPSIIGIYNTGSQNIIINAASGTINSSAEVNVKAYGILSWYGNFNTLTNTGNIK